MPEFSHPLVWLAAVVLMAIVIGVARNVFGREARERRRRQRSHGRVVSKVARPMVSLAVDAEKNRSERPR